MDAADAEHDEGGEPPGWDDQGRLGTASTTKARASTPAEASEAVVSGRGNALVRRPASPNAPSSSASPAPCTGPRGHEQEAVWRSGPVLVPARTGGERLAAAVADAASDTLASAPPAMAMARSALDPRPTWPASRATDAENTAREAADRS